MQLHNLPSPFSLLHFSSFIFFHANVFNFLSVIHYSCANVILKVFECGFEMEMNAILQCCHLLHVKLIVEQELW